MPSTAPPCERIGCDQHERNPCGRANSLKSSHKGSVAMSETTGPPRDAWMNTFRFLQELTGRMHRAGITLLAGSDYVSPAEGLVPGKSILEEIQLLEESGLTHREAVDAASVNITNWLKTR